MKIFIIVVLALFLGSCTTKTVFTRDDGRVYRLETGADTAEITIKSKDEEITMKSAENRSTLELLFPVLIRAIPDLEVDIGD